MTTANVPISLPMRLLGRPRTSANQDVRTVAILRLSVGVIGFFLPITLIAGNWLLGDRAIVPSSISGSYYSSTRNLFVGSLCALGVFLIGYRHTERQNRCTWFAGLFALTVAFAPTAPPRPKIEPTWVNYLHHIAAGALILTLGLFCWVFFADFVDAGSLRAWAAKAWDSLRRHKQSSLYLICGAVVLVSGALAFYTGVWPTGWSTGWQSLYCFEGIAVAAFGVAWISVGFKLFRASHAPADGRLV